MAQLLTAALTFAASFAVLGPGALSPADAGVLERVQERRLSGCCERNLERRAPPGCVLLATESCEYIGADALLVVSNVGAYRARVVDCQRRDELPRLHDLGILADENWPGLGHRQAYLIVWRHYHATLPD